MLKRRRLAGLSISTALQLVALAKFGTLAVAGEHAPEQLRQQASEEDLSREA